MDRERERDWPRRGEDRGFFDRAEDEVRSWFGDEDAQHRRSRDERWGGSEGTERDWARQWGYLEGRGPRESERSWGRGWGYSGGYGAGAGYRGGRQDWARPVGYEPDMSGYGPSSSGQDYGSERYGAGWRGGVRQGPYVGRGPRGYRRSDERIKEDVCERMCMHGELDASEIDIVVTDGEVTLQGSVADRHAKRLAEDLAEQASGVREIHNQLRISSGTLDQRTQPPWSEGSRHRAA